MLTFFSPVFLSKSLLKNADVFVNGLFISENDYVYDNKGNDFYIKFIKTKFPDFDRFGNVYELDETDEVKINGDLEKFAI